MPFEQDFTRGFHKSFLTLGRKGAEAQRIKSGIFFPCDLAPLR